MPESSVLVGIMEQMGLAVLYILARTHFLVFNSHACDDAFRGDAKTTAAKIRESNGNITKRTPDVPRKESWRGAAPSAAVVRLRIAAAGGILPLA